MASQRWSIDTSRSGVHFIARHMVISKVRGAFDRWEGAFDFDEQSPAASKATARFEVASIDTREPTRDAFLRSPDFFDAERYPAIAFESTRVEQVGGNRYRVTGDLTIRGVTRQVVLDAEHLGDGKAPRGNARIRFQAHTTLSRKDFGLTWSQALEAGGVLVGDKVEIEVEILAAKAPSDRHAG